MKFFSNLFRHKASNETVAQESKLVQRPPAMTAKEKQSVFIKEALKVLLKSEGTKLLVNGGSLVSRFLILLNYKIFHGTLRTQLISVSTLQLDS